MKKNKGGIVFTVSLGVFVVYVLFMFFAIIVFRNNINLLLYQLKNDIYSINRNAVFAVERDLMGKDLTKLNSEELIVYIKAETSNAWNLDKNLRNGKGLVEYAKILELEVLEEGDIDSITKDIVECTTVHTVLGVKVKPIIFSSIMEDKFYFKLHEDLKVRKME